MDSFMKEFEHLVIKLEDVKSATNNFDEKKVIGGGGFGKVYKGEVSHYKGRSMVAFKRLDRKFGQGGPEFWKEIMMLSRYTHENLISLLGYCNEGGEMILVYEHASNGSLDRHLSSTTLTWIQRIKICLDVARGISYLHDDKGTQQRVLHRDIKSSNILLDEKWNAKVSDLGLAKIGPANQQHTALFTTPVGTLGYLDPLYLQIGILTKESDVYSFGVVLFEVLCGRLCYEKCNGGFMNLVGTWKKRCKLNKIDELILKDSNLKNMDPTSLVTFTDIALRCLNKSREERPMMADVVEKLEIALKSQEYVDLIPKEHEEIVKAVVPPLIYKSMEELKVLLSKGVILNGGKTWLCINEKGKHIERIYIETCLSPDEIEDYRLQHPSDEIVNSRFPGGRCYKYYSDFTARVRGQYLTPQISYTANLVFRYYNESKVNSHNPLRYKIDGEDDTKVFLIYPSAHMREDGWFIVPLYHFTTQHKAADLQFEFEYRCTYLLVAGIEFQPCEEKVVFEEYQHIVEAASQPLVYTSLDELKQILTQGVHLNRYKTWFSINEKGQHCHMISMKDCLIPNEDYTPQYESHRWSRFPAGFYDTNSEGFKTHVKTHFLSPSVTYTVNLVYKSNSWGEQVHIDLKYRLRGEATTSVVYLASLRKDDLLHMVELYQFTSDGSIVDLEIIFENCGANIHGVEGIMFQPLEIVEDQVSKEDKVENIQTVSDSESDTYWEEKLPNDYEEILNLSKDSLMWTMKKGMFSKIRRGFLETLNSSKDSLQWTTKKELYSILRRGFLINNGQEWFTIDKHGKKCPMLSARATWVIDDKNSACKSSHESRFGEVRVITAGDKFELVIEIKPAVISADTTYASYLVYKLPKVQSTFETPLCVWEMDDYNLEGSYVYLVSPPGTPVIGPKFDENRYNPLNRHKLSALPKQRSDGWMEVKVWQFDTRKTSETVSMHLKLDHPVKNDLSGLIIHGIELRPI